MGGTTSKMGIPYPDNNDFVTDGATDMQALADQVDLRSGLVKIIPTVSGSGVSVDSSGTVTFAAVTLGVMNDAFPSAFNNFVVIVSDFSGTTLENLNLRLYTSSAITTNYRSGGRFGTYAGSFGDVASVTDRFACGSVNSASDKTSAILHIFNPNVAVITAYTSETSNRDAWVSYGGQNTNTTAYSNLSLGVGSGNCSGKISIYGYR